MRRGTVLAGVALAALVCAVWLLACGGVARTGYTPVELKTYRDGEELLARGRYAEALSLYRELAATSGDSRGLDYAYLRMVRLYLLEPVPGTDWPSWYGADYNAARDTVHSMLERFPDSDHWAEATIWARLLDRMTSLEARLEETRDSVAVLQTALEERHVAEASNREQLGGYLRRLAELRGEKRSVSQERNRLARENRELRAEVEQLRGEITDSREEIARMQRMLLNLQGSSEDGP